MRTALFLGSSLVSLLLALTACGAASDDVGDVEQGKKVEPSDETAVLTVTVPAALPLKTGNGVHLPGVVPVGETRPRGDGEWVFYYVLGTDHLLVEPGTPVAVRPGGCLYTSYSSLVAAGYSQITDKDCDLGLVAGSSKTHALGGVRLHFGTEPLRVDFGKKARPHLEDSKGAAVFATVGSQGFGNYPGFYDQPDKAEWKLNFPTLDDAGAPKEFLAAPIRSGKYMIRFDAVGLDGKSVTVSAGAIAELDATPPDIRSTVRFTDDDPAPFAQAALQVLDLQLGADEDTAGHLTLQTGGLEAKFLPTGTGTATDTVSYRIDDYLGTSKQVTIKARGTGNAVLSRIDVDEVSVNGGGATEMVRGRWSLDYWDGAAWSSYNTCYSQDPRTNRCTGGTNASNLGTKSGVFVPDGKYRVSVVYKTTADPAEKTKLYEVSIP